MKIHSVPERKFRCPSCHSILEERPSLQLQMEYDKALAEIARLNALLEEATGIIKGMLRIESLWMPTCLGEANMGEGVALCAAKVKMERVLKKIGERP